MARKKNSTDPLLVVSGGQTVLRLRFLKHLIETKRSEGVTIEQVDGEDHSALRDALEGNPFLATKTLAIVRNPEKIPLEMLEAHLATEADTTLLLHIEGEPDGRTKFGKFVKKELGKLHKAFPKPTEWKAPEVAAAFVLDEVKRHGLTIGPGLAPALVSHVGSDLGMLVFEIDKMAMLAAARGVTVLGTPEVKGAMAPLAEASVSPLVEALSSRNRKNLSRALVRLGRTSKTDPTMRICGLLRKTVTRWVQAVYLDALPPVAAAEELGLNKWYFETKILPPAKRWGKKGTVKLAQGIARAERAVLQGALNPWLLLSTYLLEACDR